MGVSIDLSGRKALITGATRGIGKAIAEDFLKAGAKVLLTGTSRTKIDDLAKNNANPMVKWLHADFDTRNGIDAFLDELNEVGVIDICVNNAGINIIKPFEDYSIAEYERLLSVNVTAPFLIVKFIISGMKDNSYGRIVNIASIWSEISKPGRSLYSTSKTGLVGFTRTISVEYAANNILVNAVSPGFTRTELTEKSLTGDEIEELSARIPMQRIAEPSEIAKTVLFLCSDLNTYITGQNIVIDGGFTIV